MFSVWFMILASIVLHNGTFVGLDDRKIIACFWNFDVFGQR